MFDNGLAIEVLQQILQATLTISERFKPVNSVEDFTETPAGMEKLDSICMLLIAVGENLKNIDKITSGKLLPKYPQVDWKKAKGLRDIISHHYFDVDADAIFHICNTYIDQMSQTIGKIIDDLS
jgi:uncharacterized protein with HEPN domain